jgi:hypothetical protein
MCSKERLANMADETKPDPVVEASARYKSAVAGLTKHDADIVVARATLEKLLQARPKAVGEVASSAISLLKLVGGDAPSDIFKQVS